MKIIIDHHQVAGVPVLEFYNPEVMGKRPAVVILHGFTGRKEDHLPHGYLLAGQGFFAVAIDLPMHGELGGANFVPEKVTPHLLDIVTQTMDQLDALADVYTTHPLVDARRMGLMGISLGGSFIYIYLPRRHANYKAAVTLISGGTPFLGKTFRSLQVHFPQFGVTDDLVSFLEGLSSQYPFLEGVKDFPLLIQNGVQDPVIPIDEVRSMVVKAKANYFEPEKLQFIEYPQYGHDNPPVMYDEAVKWFKQTLLG